MQEKNLNVSTKKVKNKPHRNIRPQIEEAKRTLHRTERKNLYSSRPTRVQLIETKDERSFKKSRQKWPRSCKGAPVQMKADFSCETGSRVLEESTPVLMFSEADRDS